MYIKFASIVYLVAVVTAHNIPGYYWRDFYGIIPEDALPGGKDLGNNPIYIGQVYAKYLIPAKIYQNDKHAYYEYGGKELSVTQNIKILCTQNPEEFMWVHTDNNHINSIVNISLVIGGYEPGCTTYIGRIRKGGEVLVGKALADNPPGFAGLHVTQNGAKHLSTSFDVLAYEPNELPNIRAAK